MSVRMQLAVEVVAQRRRRRNRPVGWSFERDDLGRKRCSDCAVWLAEGEFVKNRAARDGLNSICRGCQSIGHLLRKFGLTHQAYLDLLAKQQGRCAVCRDPEPGGRGRWHVDHDHSCCPGKTSCGKCVRGLLCAWCNGGLGLFRDDTARLRAAADYLELRK